MISYNIISGIPPIGPTLPTILYKLVKENWIIKITPEGESRKISLKVRAQEIPRKCLDFFKDEDWMTLIVDLFGIASRSLELTGAELYVPYVPYLSIASAPFSLGHAVKNSIERIQLMSYAARTSRVADVFFWLGRGIDSVGSTLSSIVRPFAGGLEVAGLTSKLISLGVIFTRVIPMILIVSGAIGGLSEGWAMMRTHKVLKQFNQEVGKQNGSLEALAKTLEYLQGSQLLGIKNSKERALKEKYFNENHFTNNQRREAVLKRVRTLMDPQALSSMLKGIDSIKNVESYSKLNDLIDLIEKNHSIFQNLTKESSTEFKLIDETLALYQILLNQIDTDHELYQGITQNQKDLIALRKNILQEGGEIIGTVRSEIHRILTYHAVFILIASISLIAGVLLLYPQYLYIGYGLALASSSLSVLYILFDKTVSQESFYKMDRFFQNLLEKKSGPSVQ